MHLIILFMVDDIIRYENKNCGETIYEFYGLL